MVGFPRLFHTFEAGSIQPTIQLITAIYSLCHFFLEKTVELVNGGSIINRAYTILFLFPWAERDYLVQSISRNVSGMLRCTTTNIVFSLSYYFHLQS